MQRMAYIGQINYMHVCVSPHLSFIVFTTRENKVHRVGQVQQVFRDRQEMLAVQDPEGNQEKKECQELMDYQESEETLEHR